MTAIWAGALTVGDCWALWRGRSGDNRLHRHFAEQVVHAPNPVAVIDAVGQTVRGETVLVDPFVPHRLEPTENATILYLEPSALKGAELAAELARLDPHAPSLASSPSYWRKRRAIPLCTTPLVDAARARIDALIDGGPVALAAVTYPSGLSSARFRHRFVAEAGLSVRRCVEAGSTPGSFAIDQAIESVAV